MSIAPSLALTEKLLAESPFDDTRVARFLRAPDGSLRVALVNTRSGAEINSIPLKDRTREGMTRAMRVVATLRDRMRRGAAPPPPQPAPAPPPPPFDFGAGSPDPVRRRVPEPPVIPFEEFQGVRVPKGATVVDASREERPITVEYGTRGYEIRASLHVRDTVVGQEAFVSMGFSRAAGEAPPAGLSLAHRLQWEAMHPSKHPYTSRSADSVTQLVAAFPGLVQFTSEAAEAWHAANMANVGQTRLVIGVARDGSYVASGNTAPYRDPLRAAGWRNGSRIGEWMSESPAPVHALLASVGWEGVDVDPAVARDVRSFGVSLAGSSVHTGEACTALVAPVGRAYMPFQCAGIAYAMQRRNTLIGDDMGLGKTVEAIGYINNTPAVHSAIVVVPASLVANWRREFALWLARPMRLYVVESAADSIPADAEIVIVNYEKLIDLSLKKGSAVRESRVFRELMARRWGLLVVDEVHRLKASHTEQQKASVAVFGRLEYDESGNPRVTQEGLSQRVDRRIYLSGTPMPNRTIEMWPYLHDLAPERFPNLIKFGTRYAGGVRGKRAWEFKGNTRSAELHDLLRGTVMVRRLKVDVLRDLPPKRRQVVMLPASILEEAGTSADAELDLWSEVEAQMEEARANASAAILAGDREGYAAAVDGLINLPVVSPKFAGMSRARANVALAKVPYVVEHVLDLIESGAESVVVMAHHHTVQDALVKAFNKSLGEGSAVMHRGGMSAADKDAAVMAFQGGVDARGVSVPPKPGVRIFVGSILASGVGITLTRSRNMVFAELDWVPGNVSQAEDRIYRIGTQDSVLIQHLVVDRSIDAMLIDTVLAKQAAADAVLDTARVPMEYALRDGAFVARREVAGAAESVASGVSDVSSSWEVATILSFSRTSRTAAPLGAYDMSVVNTVVRMHTYGLTDAQRRAATGVALKIRGAAPTELTTAARGPVNALEKWAATAIRSLASADQDYARERNRVGFSQSDSNRGHLLAALIDAGAMTEDHWHDAIRIAKHYERTQVGTAPKANGRRAAVVVSRAR